MTNSYLEKIKDQERKLEIEQERLKLEKNFYNSCLKFSCFGINQTIPILDRIAKLISAYEGEEYILHEFSITEDGMYVTEYYSRLEGLPNVSGAELAATQTENTVWKKPQTYSEKRIVKKSTYDIFSKLSFPDHYSYFLNLNKILKDQKHFVFNGVFSPEDFYKQFPYVTKYLESLVYWRLENHTLTIPEEVMDSLLTIPDKPDEMKLNKKPLE